MGWIAFGNAERTVYSEALKLEEGESVILSSFKKDRTIRITKGKEGFAIEEDGFENSKFSISDEELKKKIKKLLAFEFPRSHKIMLSIRKGS
ncbi:hypothetical protein Mia14_0604 [Candidatus Mancarchaeum acidiphilum]|uniref:Uncharacterized protein n=1 Tax=Candidatus Mancarchaeum acidiphilum TaxID=1920749 RepID=A0A218NN65_9ARCH|nr:hypothetical protein [Candidatus Mancarchaeum acidiphilum]ASI13907.1 hypothetical protein Mia14_0604 [Candidatus Mancarchaeum acidiphilum]